MSVATTTQDSLSFSINAQPALTQAQVNYDRYFTESFRAKYPFAPINGVEAAIITNLGNIDRNIQTIDRMFDGTTVEARVKGAEELLSHRRNLAIDVFQKGVRPEIEKLLIMHGEERSFDQVVSICGFNRLFVRDVASAGTDVDFILFVDSENKALVADIQKLITTNIGPQLQKSGIDMEAAPYLMINLPDYLKKLDTTRKSLFTLANMSQDNTLLIAGSEEIRRRAFSLTDEQIAEHFTNLLLNHRRLTADEAPAYKGSLIAKLESGNRTFRREILSRLQRMASSELYIGGHPYDGKKTIQTILRDVNPLARQERTAPFSLKFCLQRIGDFINTTNRFETATTGALSYTKTQINHLETLGITLSNIICRQNSEAGHPAIELQEGYSDLKLEHLQQLEPSDRAIITNLLKTLDIRLNPTSVNFAEECYDALWTLGDRMHALAAKMEENLYSAALRF